VQPSIFDRPAGASPAPGMAMIGLGSDNRLGEGRPSPGKLGSKRARTDRVEATKPEDVVGPGALANPGAAALSEHCSLDNEPPREPNSSGKHPGSKWLDSPRRRKQCVQGIVEQGALTWRGRDGGNRNRSDKAKKGR
jgi:hypothetical protein